MPNNDYKFIAYILRDSIHQIVIYMPSYRYTATQDMATLIFVGTSSIWNVIFLNVKVFYGGYNDCLRATTYANKNKLEKEESLYYLAKKHTYINYQMYLHIGFICNYCCNSFFVIFSAISN
jgi:hypothetical protein